MSFDKIKDEIEYGNTVMLFVGYDNMLPIIVQKNKVHQTKFGSLKHDHLVGKRFGTRFQCSKGWVYLLHPNPELWTISLPHRTQILYSTDISLIIFNLDLRPGSVVVEAGTGSGSLSHSILRTIQPSGFLYTFEFHEERSEKARQEFVDHGLSEFVKVTHQDVCGDGFQLSHVADAVFLDLPRPWECIQSAKGALKIEGGRISSFSPCIEQVQRTCEQLTDCGFQEVTTVECLSRSFNIKNAKLQNLKFGDETSELDDAAKISETSSSSTTSDSQTDSKPEEKDYTPPTKVLKIGSGVKDHKDKSAQKAKSADYHCLAGAVPAMAMQGHTGFLTFATLPPQSSS